MEITTRSETPRGADKPSLNPDALNQLVEQMVNDLGAAVNGALVVLGDELGIYTALADIGPATSKQLAKKTKLHERQLREWLSAQAASRYVSYDAASDAFFLTAEQVAMYAKEKAAKQKFDEVVVGLGRVCMEFQKLESVLKAAMQYSKM